MRFSSINPVFFLKKRTARSRNVALKWQKWRNHHWMSQINNKSQTFLFTVACYYGRRLPGFIGCCSGDSLSPQQWLFMFVLLCTFNREVIWACGQSNNWSTLSGGVIDGGDLSCVWRLWLFDLARENAGLRGVEWLQLQRRHISRLWVFFVAEAECNVMHDM